jgi:pyoverdine/dityrosine biosynthesis protein Dit1
VSSALHPVILVVRSDIASLFSELITIDNTMILTEKTSLHDFYRAVSASADGGDFPAEEALRQRTPGAGADHGLP